MKNKPKFTGSMLRIVIISLGVMIVFIACTNPNDPQTVSQGRIEYYWVDQHGSLVTTGGGAAAVAPGETLTITPQGTGYVVQQWHLNGKNTNQSGNTYTFSSATAGKHTVGLFVEKDGNLFNTNITITVQ